MKLVPLEDRIVVRTAEAEETTVSGLVIPDTAADPIFASHPLVVGAPFIRFYASARLAFEGHQRGRKVRRVVTVGH